MIRTLKKFWATLGLISLELLIVLALFVVSLLAFGFITYNIFRLDETNFDANVFISLRPYVTETNTRVMNFITFFNGRCVLISTVTVSPGNMSK